MSARPRLRIDAHTLARAILLAASFAVPLALATGKSVTYDEVAHLPAGYSYWRTGEIRLNPMHPPLVKELCALPLLALDPPLPVEAEALRRPDLPLSAQWEFGRRFLAWDVERLVFWGRVPAALLSAGLAALLARWAAELWGRGGALVALFSYVFDPTVAAHAPLVTTDVGLAFFGALYLYALRRFLAAPRPGRLLACGVALGLALGAKFSALVLLPVTAVLVLLARPLEPSRPAPRAVSLFALAAVAALVLWAIYFFPSDPLFYWRGLRTVNADHAAGHPALLLGELRVGGWRSYLLVAWLLKTPVPTLLLLAAATLRFARGHRAPWLEEAFLAVPAASFFLAYSLGSDNAGVRYLLPVYPYLFLFAARTGALLEAGRRARALVAASLAWLALEFAAISPDHLSYFNLLAGGPRRGPEWLDDSNVDWGQGLIQLRQYLERHDLGSFRLCYFGSFDPQGYGVRPAGEVSPQELASARPPGNLVLSAHCVARARALLRREHGEGPGNWLAHEEPAAVVGHAYYVYVERARTPSP